MGFCVFFQLAQHQRGQFFGTEFFAVQLEDFVCAHKAFEGGYSGVRGGTQPFARRQADQHCAAVVHADDGRGEEVPKAVGDKMGFAVFELGDEAVGGAEVYTDLCCHGVLP